MTARRLYRTLMHDSSRWDRFTLRDGDVVVSTPPKAGTTWTQTICLMLLHDTVVLPAPVAELSPWLDQQVRSIDEVVAALEAQAGRRVIKTHTPLDGLPFVDGVSYVCVGRDPHDMAMSMVDHQGNLDMDRVLELRADAVGNADLDEFGPSAGPPADPAERLRRWVCEDPPYSMSSLRRALHHWRTFWEVAGDERVLMVHYRDLHDDRGVEVARLAEFLGLPADRRRDEQVVAATEFETMRADATRYAPNAAVGLWQDDGRFFRAGRFGDGQRQFDESLRAAYDSIVAESVSDELAHWIHHGRRPPSD